MLRAFLNVLRMCSHRQPGSRSSISSALLIRNLVCLTLVRLGVHGSMLAHGNGIERQATARHEVDSHVND